MYQKDIGVYIEGQWLKRAEKRQLGVFALNVVDILKLKSSYVVILVALYINIA